MKKTGLEKAIGNCNLGALASFLRSLLLKHVEENSTDESPFIATDNFRAVSRISSLLESLEKQPGKQYQTEAKKNNSSSRSIPVITVALIPASRR